MLLKICYPRSFVIIWITKYYTPPYLSLDKYSAVIYDNMQLINRISRTLLVNALSYLLLELFNLLVIFRLFLVLARLVSWCPNQIYSAVAPVALFSLRVPKTISIYLLKIKT